MTRVVRAIGEKHEHGREEKLSELERWLSSEIGEFSVGLEKVPWLDQISGLFAILYYQHQLDKLHSISPHLHVYQVFSLTKEISESGTKHNIHQNLFRLLRIRPFSFFLLLKKTIRILFLVIFSPEVSVSFHILCQRLSHLAFPWLRLPSVHRCGWETTSNPL